MAKRIERGRPPVTIEASEKLGTFPQTAPTEAPPEPPSHADRFLPLPIAGPSERVHAPSAITEAARTRFIATERQTLEDAHEVLARSLESEPGRPVLRGWTRTIDAMLGRIDSFVQQTLGPPPSPPGQSHSVGYAFFCSGSYARDTLSPYSDIDYGLLIARDFPEGRAYFHRYAAEVGQLLSQIDETGALHPCDLISPTGEAKDALIDTPAQMARRASGASDSFVGLPSKAREYLVASLNATRAVFARHGGEQLHDEFSRQRESELGPTFPNLEPQSRRAEVLQTLLRSLRDPFGVPKRVPGWAEPSSASKHVALEPEQALALGRVNVKHDLLKAIQFPIFALRALYGSSKLELGEVLRELEDRGLVNPALTRRLTEIHDTLLTLRAKNHVRHGRSEERLAPLTDAQARAIRRMVPVLFRLRQELERLETEDPNRFSLGGGSQ